MRRLFSWYLHQRLLGYALFTVGMAYAGFGAATSHVISSVTPKTEARTVTSVATRHTTRYVTIHVKGHVLRRYDHVLVVYVPRTTFRNHATHRRVVVPAHVVKIREPMPVFGVTNAAIIGVAPPPVTVYVPVTVTIPAATVTGPTTTVTLPQATTTVTVPTTITVPFNPDS